MRATRQTRTLEYLGGPMDGKESTVVEELVTSYQHFAVAGGQLDAVVEPAPDGERWVHCYVLCGSAYVYKGIHAESR